MGRGEWGNSRRWGVLMLLFWGLMLLLIDRASDYKGFLFREDAYNEVWTLWWVIGVVIFMDKLMLTSVE